MNELSKLREDLSEVQLSEGRDEVVWLLEKLQKYSTKSLYSLLTSCGVLDTQMMMVWKCPIPLKVKIFVWMTAHDRIQCGVQLKKKMWSVPEKSLICESYETSDHIMFQCPIAVFLWAFVRDCFGWSVSPTSCASMFRIIEREE